MRIQSTCSAKYVLNCIVNGYSFLLPVQGKKKSRVELKFQDLICVRQVVERLFYNQPKWGRTDCAGVLNTFGLFAPFDSHLLT